MKLTKCQRKVMDKIKKGKSALIENAHPATLLSLEKRGLIVKWFQPYGMSKYRLTEKGWQI